MADKKYLDLAGLTHFWSNVKTYVDNVDGKKVDKTTTVNGQKLEGPITLAGTNITVGGAGAHKEKTVAAAIDALNDSINAAAGAARVTSFGGKTGVILVDTAQATDGNIVFAMSEQMLTGKLVGFNKLATTDALNAAKSALQGEINKKANQTALETANNEINALKKEKAAKSEALGNVKVSGSATPVADGVDLTVSVTPVTVNTNDLGVVTGAIKVKKATEGELGVVTLGTIKNLAAQAATSTYKVKGSKESLTEVLAVPSAVVGDVYNVKAGFTLNGQPYPAGTNVVFIGHGAGEGTDDPKQQAQWDALGGTVDLSPYATIASLNDAKDELQRSISGVGKRVDTLSGTVGAHTTEITNLKDADSKLGGRISTLETWKGEADKKFASLEGSVSTLTEADKALSGRIQTLETWKGGWARIENGDIDVIFAPKP